MFMDRCIREVMSSVCLAVCLSVCLSIYSMVPVDDGGHIMMLVWAHEYTGIGSYCVGGGPVILYYYHDDVDESWLSITIRPCLPVDVVVVVVDGDVGYNAMPHSRTK